MHLVLICLVAHGFSKMLNFPCTSKSPRIFFYINVKYYNIFYVLLYFNYYATLQGRYQEEQKTMSTLLPTHENTQLNQQLNKHLQNGTHTIRYDTDGYWNLFRIGMQFR